jgi:hypothetical protein
MLPEVDNPSFPAWGAHWMLPDDCNLEQRIKSVELLKLDELVSCLQSTTL